MNTDLRPAPLTGLSIIRAKHGVPVVPSNHERLQRFRDVYERENLPLANAVQWPHLRKKP